jgi:hypothetical protein
MRTSRAWVTAACLCLAPLAQSRADAPNGPYVTQVGGDSEIWYPDGTSMSCDPEHPGEVCITDTTQTDGTGAVTGTGVLAIHIPDQVDGDLSLVITGHLGGSTTKPKPKLTVEITGDLTYFVVDDPNAPGRVVHFVGSATWTCSNPSPHADIFECTDHMKLCGTEGESPKQTCFRGASGVPVTVAAEGGPWVLETLLSTDTEGKGAITGTGVTTLFNEGTEGWVANGKWNAKTDQSSYKLTSTSPGTKDKITFSQVSGSLYSPTGSQKKMKFKVAGVSGTFTLPTVPP